MKYKQCDLVVLALAEKGTWCPPYIFKGWPFKDTFIGSEADTRLYELFDKKVSDAPLKIATRKIDGDVYTIETKKDGARRMYRAYISKPRPIYQYIETPTGVKEIAL